MFAWSSHGQFQNDTEGDQKAIQSLRTLGCVIFGISECCVLQGQKLHATRQQ